MTDEGGDDAGSDGTGNGLGRRTAIGTLLGVAAGGVAGVAVGRSSAEGAGSDDGDETPDASEIRVTPEGELVAEDVQGALTAIIGRTSATIRLDDLRVAYEIVDDFPPTADRIGSQGWTAVTDGGGTVEPTNTPGGIVALAAGSGRAALHLGTRLGLGTPVFTLEWRARVLEGTAAVLGAPSDLDGGLEEALGYFFTIGADDGTWSCGCGAASGRTIEDTEVPVDEQFHRFRITCDGDLTARFAIDDQVVAEITTDLPGTEDRYGFGVAALSGTMEVDWAYQRTELAR